MPSLSPVRKPCAREMRIRKIDDEITALEERIAAAEVAAA
jgi:hypothetical protein